MWEKSLSSSDITCYSVILDFDTVHLAQISEVVTPELREASMSAISGDDRGGDSAAGSSRQQQQQEEGGHQTLQSDLMKPTVHLIACGGTMDKDYPKRVGGYNFEITAEPGAFRVVQMATEACGMMGFHLRSLPLMQKDSLDMTDADVAEVLKTVKSTATQALREKPGEMPLILVTHGTSTMVKTAQVLSQDRELEQLRTRIVFTGSFLPQTFTRSDASFNVAFALGALLSAQITGTFVAMNGQCIPAERCVQNDHTGMFSLAD